MGVPSPFVGAATSPALPKLEACDELAGVEALDLSQPKLDFIKEDPQIGRLWNRSQRYDLGQAEAYALAVDGAPPPGWQRPREAVSRPVPEWPSNLPDRLHEVTELNTFLDLPRPLTGEEEAPSRRRAGSDWSGVRSKEAEGFEVSLEELRSPLPPAPWRDEAACEEQAAAEAYGAGQWCWMQDEAGNAWMVMCQEVPSQSWPATPQSEPVARLPPPPPEGTEAYRPKWIYGSSWPFNHAPTTLTLERLPRELTQTELLAVLDDAGFSGLYDFVFVPVSMRTGRNQGEAIVNFTRHSYGLAFAARAHGFSGWGLDPQSRACEVKWSLPLQGLAEHVENYRNHPAMHESVPEAFRPMLFMQGWQVPFPLPTRFLRAPRLGHW